MTIRLLEADILRQPKAFRDHKERILTIEQKLDRQLKGQPVVMTGIATSLYAMTAAHFYLASQKPGVAELISTCDLLDYWYPQAEDLRPLIILSRSGESAEIIRLLNTISKERMVIGVTEGKSSPLARRSNILLDFEANEQAFPNTISFTLSQIYALAMVHGMGFKAKKSLESLLTELNNLSNMILNNEDCSDIGAVVADSRGVILEGQGIVTGVIEQYSLDFHETRAICVPVLGGIMRHGPVELTEQRGLVTCMLIPHDATTQRKIAIAEELCNDRKQVVVLTNSDAPIDERIKVYRLPKCSSELSSLVFTLGLQKVFTAYAKHKGLVNLTPNLVGKVTGKE